MDEHLSCAKLHGRFRAPRCVLIPGEDGQILPSQWRRGQVAEMKMLDKTEQSDRAQNANENCLPILGELHHQYIRI